MATAIEIMGALLIIDAVLFTFSLRRNRRMARERRDMAQYVNRTERTR